MAQVDADLIERWQSYYDTAQEICRRRGHWPTDEPARIAHTLAFIDAIRQPGGSVTKITVERN